MDLGVHGVAGLAGIGLMESLTRYKRLASGTNGIPWDDCHYGVCTIFPSSGKSTYRFRLQTPNFILYLFSTINRDGTPPFFASLQSRAIWTMGVTSAVGEVRAFLEAHGIDVERIVPSRVDICADFLAPGGMCLPFLLDHLVPGSLKNNPHLKGGVLETLYLGDKSSPIRCRIYNKTEACRVHKTPWFYELWGISPDEKPEVWRFEFQLRRPALKSYQVDSMESLLERLGGIWKDVTGNWVSFRALDDSNTSRRSILPFWQTVQAVSGSLGPEIDVRREITTSTGASAMWYIKRAAAYLCGYAAAMGFSDFENALAGLMECIRDYWREDDKSFSEEYQRQRIRRGLDVSDDRNGDAGLHRAVRWPDGAETGRRGRAQGNGRDGSRGRI